MLLNIEKEKPEVVLDIDRIATDAEEALRQYPDKLSPKRIDLVARADGGLTIKTADGGELQWPADRKAEALAARPAAVPQTPGPVPPPAPAGPVPVAPRPTVSGAAARAYGGAALPRNPAWAPPAPGAPAPRPAAPGMGGAARAYGGGGVLARPGTAGQAEISNQLQQLTRSVTTAENAAVRKHLTAHQQEFLYDYQRLVQALKVNDNATMQELRATCADAISQDPEVQKAREALRSFKEAHGMPG